MGLAATYVAIPVPSGVLFTLLRHRVRKARQPRLYRRFLTEADYKSLVGGPAGMAEIALWACSAFGVIAIVLMALAISKIEPKPIANEVAGAVANARASSLPPSPDPIASGSNTRMGPGAGTTPGVAAAGSRVPLEAAAPP